MNKFQKAISDIKFAGSTMKYDFEYCPAAYITAASCILTIGLATGFLVGSLVRQNIKDKGE